MVIELSATMENTDRRKHLKFILFLFSLAFILTTTVFSQSYQGGLRGSLRDSGGNMMPSVTITLTNEATNVARTTVTNGQGEYVFEKVDPGRYRIEAAQSGFKKLERPGVIV
ncbi:MAG: carboxypeptidase regulatory-like domain-containing protein, partial [Blastocatellia bacterium]|nr:carboxypeptidase regulatory-like domain-containing protein [Blastocatellia bacterium]